MKMISQLIHLATTVDPVAFMPTLPATINLWWGSWGWSFRMTLLTEFCSILTDLLSVRNGDLGKKTEKAWKTHKLTSFLTSVVQYWLCCRNSFQWGSRDHGASPVQTKHDENLINLQTKRLMKVSSLSFHMRSKQDFTSVWLTWSDYEYHYYCWPLKGKLVQVLSGNLPGYRQVYLTNRRYLLTLWALRVISIYR